MKIKEKIGKEPEPATTWKLVKCNLSADNKKRNTQPLQWVDTWAHDTVLQYWSADTLFWQLSIDHNMMNVQNQVAASHTS